MKIENNTAFLVSKYATSNPHKTAVIKSDKKVSFLELEEQSNSLASFISENLDEYSKVLVFIKPSTNFSMIVFSLFKAKMIPIFIDPGMGIKNLLQSIKQIKPIGLIAEKEVFLAKLFFRSTFKSVKFSITNSSLPLLKVHSLKHIVKNPIKKTFIKKVQLDDPAAILFTSGGTGIPKGVLYTHGVFNSQIHLLKESYSLNDSDIDLPGFPLFGLFTLSMGMTNIIPDMDPSKPANVNPEKIINNINKYKPTFLAGSPSIWLKVGKYAKENNLKFNSVKNLVMFGAPISPELHFLYKDILTNGRTSTPYGATECLPISITFGDEILEKQTLEKMHTGSGTSVGRIINSVNVKIIKISDEPLIDISQIIELKDEEIGEIIVNSPTVTKEYVDMPKKTLMSKIKDGNKTWHRMGDLGYLKNNRLWFCGRLTHRIEYKNKLLTTSQIELIINNHPSVIRSALILYKFKHPALVLKLNNENKNLIKELNNLVCTSNLKFKPKFKHFFLIDHFPVDVRHNIKIDRLKLAKLANSNKLRHLL